MILIAFFRLMALLLLTPPLRHLGARLERGFKPGAGRLGGGPVTAHQREPATHLDREALAAAAPPAATDLGGRG